jgi:hypothetical protein
MVQITDEQLGNLNMGDLYAEIEVLRNA